MAAAEHHHWTFLEQLHILLAIGIMLGYLSVPFTALRKLPLTPTTQISGSFFFATCALTHLAIAVGFHNNAWMVLNDLVQLISVVVFIYSLNRQVRWVMHRRKQDRRKGTAP